MLTVETILPLRPIKQKNPAVFLPENGDDTAGFSFLTLFYFY
jgi:hypothetical protein